MAGHLSPPSALSFDDREKFHELAAQFEFIEGNHRGLAERRALRMLQTHLDPSPDESLFEADNVLVVDVWCTKISGIDYLRFSLPDELCLTDIGDAFNRVRRSFIPARFIDSGQEFSVGLSRYTGKWISGVRRIMLRRL